VRHDAGIRPDRELAEGLPRVCEEDFGETDPENPTGKLGSSAGYLHGCTMLCVIVCDCGSAFYCLCPELPCVNICCACVK
jgi:hypothetical protein